MMPFGPAAEAVEAELKRLEIRRQRHTKSAPPTHKPEDLGPPAPYHLGPSLPMLDGEVVKAMAMRYDAPRVPASHASVS